MLISLIFLKSLETSDDGGSLVPSILPIASYDSFVYDQGVTIPRALPYSNRFQSTQRFLRLLGIKSGAEDYAGDGGCYRSRSQGRGIWNRIEF